MVGLGTLFPLTDAVSLLEMQTNPRGPLRSSKSESPGMEPAKLQLVLLENITCSAPGGRKVDGGEHQPPPLSLPAAGTARIPDTER